MQPIMKIRWRLILLIVILHITCTGVLASDEALTDEEREMIEILDILENYDVLKSMDFYMDMDKAMETGDSRETVTPGLNQKEQGE